MIAEYPIFLFTLCKSVTFQCTGRKTVADKMVTKEVSTSDIHYA